ncbi:MAG: class I SAM-dependent methyltransferase [Elusimicrobiota bacterium]
MKILDIGCGNNKKHPDAVGIDFSSDSNAEIIHNLNIFPYPFGDNEFDLVYMVSILEHLDNIFKVMEEVWRITKNGGKIIIFGPTRFSSALYDDPEHKRAFTLKSFDYFIEGTKSYRYKKSKVCFSKIKSEYQMEWNKKNYSLYERCVLWWANKHPVFYTKHMESICPVQRVYFELQVVK